jgi:hypothetical protein
MPPLITLPTEAVKRLQRILDGQTMRRRLPPNVERNRVKGHLYLSYRVGKGPRTKLPDDPDSVEFKQAYADAVAGTIKPKPTIGTDIPFSIGALITSYLGSESFLKLGDGSKSGYRSRMDQLKRDHGHRSAIGLTKERIEEVILKPLHNLPGAKIDTLKKHSTRTRRSEVAQNQPVRRHQAR